MLRPVAAIVINGSINAHIGMSNSSVHAASKAALKTAIEGQIPLGRFGTAEALTSTVLHLSAKESAFIVGSELIVDGGMANRWSAMRSPWPTPLLFGAAE